LLLFLTGTLPIKYLNSTYNLPITIILPLKYPTIPPLVQLLETNGLRIRKSRFIRDGRVYHPLLDKWDGKVELVDLLRVLAREFGHDPPLEATSVYQGNNVYNHGNNSYNQGNTVHNQGNNSYTQGNNSYNHGNNSYTQGNNVYQQNNAYTQQNTVYNQQINAQQSTMYNQQQRLPPPYDGVQDRLPIPNTPVPSFSYVPGPGTRSIPGTGTGPGSRSIPKPQSQAPPVVSRENLERKMLKEKIEQGVEVVLEGYRRGVRGVEGNDLEGLRGYYEGVVGVLEGE
jgi:UEV domain